MLGLKLNHVSKSGPEIEQLVHALISTVVEVKAAISNYIPVTNLDIIVYPYHYLSNYFVEN